MKRKVCYLKCIVIVHGKSEKQLCSYIKSKLKFPMEIISRENGGVSIQINGLEDILNNDLRFATFKKFKTAFDSAEIIDKKLADYFKIFIIMDTDDCTEKQRVRYINKEIFDDHWAYEYIVPIYNTPNLEYVLEKAGIKFEKKGEERKKEYIKIFPTDKKYQNSESVELEKFLRDLAKINDTNMDQFIDFCLNFEKNYH